MCPGVFLHLVMPDLQVMAFCPFSLWQGAFLVSICIGTRSFYSPAPVHPLPIELTTATVANTVRVRARACALHCRHGRMRAWSHG